MRRFVVLLLRAFIGGIFLYAGIIKAIDPQGFVTNIEGYRVLPYSASVGAALYLPWLEILCGVSILIGRRGCLGGLTITGFLMVVFMIALIWAWLRGLDVSCGCFGAEVSQTNYALWIARDLGLLTIIGFLWLGTYRTSQLHTAQSRPC